MTVQEETGMVGACHLDPSLVRGRVMLNLDSEDDDMLFVGCAGGGDSRFHFSRPAGAVPDGDAALGVTVQGLRGGHSGLEIDKNRLNGIRALARLLQEARPGSSLRLAAIEGGDRRNAIPRRASADVTLPRADVAAFRERLQAAFGQLSDQYRGLEDDMALDVRELDPAPGRAAFGDEDTRVLLDLLLVIPVGVDAMSQSIPGLVETSNNMGIIQTQGATVEVFCNTRSSVAPAFRDMLGRLRALARLTGCEFEEFPTYPGWKVDLDSRVLQVVRRTYQRLFDAAPHVTAVHAGLEAGVISDRVAGMDVVSFGPNIRGAHAPGERVSIGSVAKFYRLLKATLDDLSSGDGPGRG
jgi:dipeptidase D